MKIEYSKMPESMADMEKWGFNWADYVTAIPTPLFLITTYKSNGQPNASLHSWACFNGYANGFYAILSRVHKSDHLYRTIHETNEAVLNFPTADMYDKCLSTISHNGFDADELAESGFTAEPAAIVNAPRIKECFLNIECRFLWEKEIKEGDEYVLMCLEAVNIAMEEENLDETKKGRFGETGYAYNVRRVVNPEKIDNRQSRVAVLEVIGEENADGK